MSFTVCFPSNPIRSLLSSTPLVEWPPLPKRPPRSVRLSRQEPSQKVMGPVRPLLSSTPLIEWPPLQKVKGAGNRNRGSNNRKSSSTPKVWWEDLLPNSKFDLDKPTLYAVMRSKGEIVITESVPVNGVIAQRSARILTGDRDQYRVNRNDYFSFPTMEGNGSCVLIGKEEVEKWIQAGAKTRPVVPPPPPPTPFNSPVLPRSRMEKV